MRGRCVELVEDEVVDPDGMTCLAGVECGEWSAREDDEEVGGLEGVSEFQ